MKSQIKTAEYQAWLYLNDISGAYEIGNYEASLVTDPQPDIVGVHGGLFGKAENVVGVLNYSQDYYNYDYTNALEFKHSGTIGILQFEPEFGAEVLSKYQHKDKNKKIVWGHSMGADASAIAYGNGLTYLDSNIPLSRPEILNQIQQSKNYAQFIDGSKQIESIHELNLVMPRVNIVLENLDNLAKNVDKVNIFMLREDKYWIPTYGNREYETLTDKLKDQDIPNNVNIIEIEHYSTTKYHGGALKINSPVLEEIFKQYKEIQNKAGDK